MNAALLVVGLAPGAHGANRTGRAFTGDYAGVILYQALHEMGLASRPTAEYRGDGLNLKNVFISNAVKCVPPDNKPVADEINRCRDFLKQELAALPFVRGIICLGGQAFKSVLRLFPDCRDEHTGKKPVFKHGAIFSADGGRFKIAAVYHPSRRNINTGRLCYDEFLRVISEFAESISDRASE